MSEHERRVAFVLGNYWGQCQGGAELQAHFIETEARRQGWSTHYCFVSNDQPIKTDDEAKLHPIRKRHLWSRIGNVKYPYARQLYRILTEIKPHVIYQRGGLSLTGVAARYAMDHGCKMIFHSAHDLDLKKSSWISGGLPAIPETMLMQYGIRNASRVIAQTHCQAQELKKNYGRDAAIIPNGHPVPPDHPKTRGGRQVLWIGNWKRIKQPEHFIEMAGRLRNEPDVRFVMCGRTEKYHDWLAMAKANGVQVLGEIPNDRVNELLAQSHVLVNTSMSEGFSNTFVQAWMRGVPVVSLAADPDGILQREGIGLRSGSLEQLVADTRRLLREPELRRSMGNIARRYAVENYSLRNIERVVELFE